MLKHDDFDIGIVYTPLAFSMMHTSFKWYVKVAGINEQLK